MPSLPSMADHIKLSSIKPLLDRAAEQFGANEGASLPEGVLTVIADHLRSALEDAGHDALEQTEEELRSFFLKAIAVAPKEAQSAAQGTGSAAASAAFSLGQAAFAHLLAARVVDMRVDRDFVKTLKDRRYLPYLRSMLEGPKDGVTLARMVKEKAETVSRKLAVLRGHGLVSARQEGTRMVNRLSPAARAMLIHDGVTPLSDTLDAQDALTQAKEEMVRKTSPYMRHQPVLGKVA